MDPNIVNDTRSRMLKAIDALKNDLATIRTGRATSALVEHIVVTVYGGSTKMKIMEVATIVVHDAHTLVLTPFDQSIIGEIAKGIESANVGVSPAVDSNVIRISIPPLSEERRQEFVKLMHQKLEGGKIMVRQERHEAMNTIKKLEFSDDEKKRLEKQVQEITDEMMAEIDVLGEKKEEELMQI